MKKGFAILPLILLSMFSYSQDLVSDQLQYERVRQAKADYDVSWQEAFDELRMNFPPKDLYIRVFKFDREVEVWARNDGPYQLVRTFEMCEVSGELGPKRKQGDLQIPEGFYTMSQFNPVSKYYLSLRVSYPNESDRILGHPSAPGGDIFIHGDCVTIGCVPIGDEGIKELYWLTVLVKDVGVEIPIHIFPFRMDEASLKFFRRLPEFKRAVWAFWEQLIPVFDYFESKREVLPVRVNSVGEYVPLR